MFREAVSGRSRSSGEYVTVLEIGSSESRSRSAGVARRGGAVVSAGEQAKKSSAGEPAGRAPAKPVSRSSSLRKVGSKASFRETGGQDAGPVSVLVKQVLTKVIKLIPMMTLSPMMTLIINMMVIPMMTFITYMMLNSGWIILLAPYPLISL